MNRFIYLISIILIIACENNTKNSTNNLYLKDYIYENINCELSDIADSIHNIYLKIDSNCILPNRSYLLSIDKNNIFIKGGKYIYRFSIEGNYINRIGSVGKGPNEYTAIFKANIDFINKQVIILDLKNTIYFFDFAGNFLFRIQPFSDRIEQMQIYNDNRIVCETRNYKNGLKSFINLIDYNGKLIQKNILETDKLNHTINLYINSIMYQTENTVKIKTPYNDTLFMYKDNRLQVSKVFGLAELVPNREIIESANKKNILYKKYVQIVDIQESQRYIFILALVQMKTRSIIFDKFDNKIIFNMISGDPRYGGGINNNFSNMNKFWPTVCTKHNNIASLINVIGKKDIVQEVVQIVYLKK